MTDALQQGLEALLTRQWRCDVRVRQLNQLTAGAAAQTWAFVAESERGEEPLILRRGHDGQQFGGALDKTREASVIKAAVAAGVPAPEVVAVLTPEDNLGEGFVMARLEGETLPQKILRDQRFQTARGRLTADCARALAAIHSVGSDALPELVGGGARQQLEFYRQAYIGFDEPLPVFDIAFAWLAERCPESDTQQVLVHGDFRNGNLMVNEQGLHAVLDWELAHLGDPMEDLGWLCVNSWRFGRRDKPVGGFGEREELFAAYGEASGRPVDPDAVRYWELFGVLKWGVICLYQTHVHLSGEERSLERAAIGRRVSECELDIIDMLKEG